MAVMETTFARRPSGRKSPHLLMKFSMMTLVQMDTSRILNASREINSQALTCVGLADRIRSVRSSVCRWARGSDSAGSAMRRFASFAAKYALDRPLGKRRRPRRAGKEALGRRQSALGRCGPETIRILRARPRPHFPRFAEDRFATRRDELEKAAGSSRRGARVDEPTAYHAEAILYLPATARYEHLLNLPEGTDIGLAVNDAMRAIERDNPHMAGVLPKSYQIFDSRLLAELLKTLSSIPSGLSGDAFGKIYEYFLGTFAMSEGHESALSYVTPCVMRFACRNAGAISRTHP